ncbi:MAG TPA: FAD:protein FMN transferase [Actinomycetes bacterium]|jgi:thiamine biosynthesis lipoprotein|nr:FAD:protein FMN transferase [Actinomycetes bacterium]
MTRPGPASPEVTAAAEWTAIGVLVRVVVSDPDALGPARRLLQRDLAALDLACSRFRPDSEIRALDGTDGRPTPVSRLLAAALAAALEAAGETDGDVDPTVGDALAAAGYDRDFSAVAADGPRIRVRPAAAPGWRLVQLDEERRIVSVPAGVRLDLGATAKAWAADRAAARIASELGCGVLVALGGDLACAGPAPDGGWQVRVQDVTGPVDGVTDGPSSQVGLHHGGIATSSTRARRWVRGGQVLHHIVDPRNGLPARSPWRTVSVAADSCLAANAASTAAVVRGARAIPWLESRGATARLVDDEGRVRLTGGWPVDVAAVAS